MKLGKEKKDKLIESQKAKAFHPRIHNTRGGMQFNAYGKHWTTGNIVEKALPSNPIITCPICHDVLYECEYECECDASDWTCPSCGNYLERN